MPSTHDKDSRTRMTSNHASFLDMFGVDSIDIPTKYPPVIKHGVLENPPFMDDFTFSTSIYMGFPSQPYLMTPEGIIL